jgi:hypothetical protein
MCKARKFILFGPVSHCRSLHSVEVAKVPELEPSDCLMLYCGDPLYQKIFGHANTDNKKA